MYIERDSAGKYILQDMSEDDVRAISRMIQGASIEERRQYHQVLCEIKKMGLF